MAGLTRFRLLPWIVLFEVARSLRSHLVDHLSPADRRRVTEIVRRSKGDPRRVTGRERADLKAIAGRLDLTTLMSELLPTIARAGGRSRRP